MKCTFILLACLSFWLRPALANDSFAAIGAGGLVLQKSDGVVMESEDLYLSLRQVKIRYVFFNSTAQDLTTIVGSV